MKKLLTIVLIASFAFVGAFGANAVTIEELQAQIATLLQQIAALQGTTTPTTPTTPSTAVCFTTDLQLGMTSSDVTSLQTVLAKDPAIYPEGLVTGYFGPLTLAAVKKYQAANNIITTGYVGPLTRGALNAQYCVTTPVTTPTTAPTATTTPVAATEGTLANTTSPTFVETTLKKGDTQKAILATKVEAKNSAIDVKRVDVELAGTSIQPWKTFSTFELYADGTLIKGVPAVKDNFIETEFVTKYVLRFDNISINVPKDQKVDLVVKTTVLENPENTAITTFKFLANAIRGVDQAGIDQYTTTAITNTIAGSAVAASSTGTLAWSLNVNSPKEGFIMGSSTATSTDKTVAIYDVKAENRDVTIKTLKVTMTDANTIASAVKLYDGSTLLSSVAGPGSADATFENLSILVAKDTTKTLTVKVDLTPVAAEGRTVKAVVTGSAAKVSAYDSNDSILGATSCSGGECVTGTATGKTQTVYTKAPTFAFGSANIVKTTQAGSADIADATITFNVTANGGDIYIKDVIAKMGVKKTSNSGTLEAADSYTFTSTAELSGGYYIIRNGETKSVTISTRLTGTDNFEAVSLNAVTWNTSASEVSEITTTHSTNYDFSTYKTTSVYLAAA